MARKTKADLEKELEMMQEKLRLALSECDDLRKQMETERKEFQAVRADLNIEIGLLQSELESKPSQKAGRKPKWTEKEEAEVMMLRAQGMFLMAISEKLGMSYGSVQKIVRKNEKQVF